MIGVVGGGQLAQMLVEAGKKRNVKVAIQTGSRADPAARQSNKLVLADPGDIEGTAKLVQSCSCVTFENEWVNIDELRLLEEEGAHFLPSLSSLEPLVDKLSQRKLLSDIGLPGPDWIPLDSPLISKSKLPIGFSYPLMAKAGRGGYDGKGTKVLKNKEDLVLLLDSVDHSKWFVEAWVEYEKELALVASRDFSGAIRYFPLVETNQLQQICDWVLAPSNVAHDVELSAFNIAASLLTQIDYVGVLAIEFFYGKDGLKINEVAPRTHNSAHFSIEACNSSQFDQNICIAAGITVPSPELIVPGALMVNLLGLDKNQSQPLDQRLKALRSFDGANLHWYGKSEEIPGRKLGHVTILLKEMDVTKRQMEALSVLRVIRSIWPMH